MADDLIVDGGAANPTGVVVPEQKTPEQIAAEAKAAEEAAAAAGKTPEQIAAEKKAAEDKAAAEAAAKAGAVTEPEQKINADGTVSFTSTGNIGMDLALEFFGKLGFKLEDAELDQAGKGNFSYLEAKLATMGDKAAGADKYVQLAKTAVAEIQGKAQAAVEARRKVVYDAVGGEEVWKGIVAHVQANAEPDELKEIRAALSAGGIGAKLMAQHLHALYTGSNPERKPAAAVTAAQPTAASSGSLTLTGYKQELNKLIERVGITRLQDSAEYAQLRQRYASVTK